MRLIYWCLHPETPPPYANALAVQPIHGALGNRRRRLCPVSCVVLCGLAVQVPGCCADMSTEKMYPQRKRICSAHMRVRREEGHEGVYTIGSYRAAPRPANEHCS